MARSEPTRRFRSVLFPALGRPAMTMRGGPSPAILSGVAHRAESEGLRPAGGSAMNRPQVRQRSRRASICAIALLAAPPPVYSPGAKCIISIALASEPLSWSRIMRAASGVVAARRARRASRTRRGTCSISIKRSGSAGARPSTARRSHTAFTAAGPPWQFTSKTSGDVWHRITSSSGRSSVSTMWPYASEPAGDSDFRAGRKHRMRAASAAFPAQRMTAIPPRPGGVRTANADADFSDSSIGRSTIALLRPLRGGSPYPPRRNYDSRATGCSQPVVIITTRP